MVFQSTLSPVPEESILDVAATATPSILSAICLRALSGLDNGLIYFPSTGGDHR